MSLGAADVGAGAGPPGQHPGAVDNWPVAIIGSGVVGTDLMSRIGNGDRRLRVSAMVGTNPHCDGLARAAAAGISTSPGGVDGLLRMPEFANIRLVFDTTNPGAHQRNWARLADTGVRMLDLTASAIGPCCVPSVNLDAQLDAPHLSMATCSAQAAVPIVAAVRRHSVVRYAEVVSAIASRALGPGERVNLDEFAELTTTAVQELGGACRAKTLTIVNPADPPMPMRTTVFCLVDQADEVARVEADVLAMVDRVQALLPGYRLKHRVQFERLGSGNTLYIPGTGKFGGTRVTVLLEITAAGGYLPACAGNVAIVTSAAKATAEAIVERHAQTVKAEL